MGRKTSERRYSVELEKANAAKVSPEGHSNSGSCCSIFRPKQLTFLSIFRIYGSVSARSLPDNAFSASATWQCASAMCCSSHRFHQSVCCCTLLFFTQVIPRCLLQASLGGIAAGVMEGTGWEFTNYDSVWRHPYALHVFGMVLGFSLVMRIQIAYQRFWEGATQCHLAASKWADAVMQVFAFDEASKDAFTEAGFEFRFLILHYASVSTACRPQNTLGGKRCPTCQTHTAQCASPSQLMHACALIDMRQDDGVTSEITLAREDPFMVRACVTCDRTRTFAYIRPIRC